MDNLLSLFYWDYDYWEDCGYIQVLSKYLLSLFYWDYDYWEDCYLSIIKISIISLLLRLRLLGRLWVSSGIIKISIISLLLRLRLLGRLWVSSGIIKYLLSLFYWDYDYWEDCGYIQVLSKYLLSLFYWDYDGKIVGIFRYYQNIYYLSFIEITIIGKIVGIFRYYQNIYYLSFIRSGLYEVKFKNFLVSIFLVSITCISTKKSDFFMWLSNKKNRKHFKGKIPIFVSFDDFTALNSLPLVCLAVLPRAFSKIP